MGERFQQWLRHWGGHLLALVSIAIPLILTEKYRIGWAIVALVAVILLLRLLGFGLLGFVVPAARAMFSALVNPLLRAGQAIVGLFRTLRLNEKFTFLLWPIIFLIVLIWIVIVLDPVRYQVEKRLDSAEECLRQDNFTCALDHVEEAWKLRPFDERVQSARYRAQVLRIARDTLLYTKMVDRPQIERLQRNLEFLLSNNPERADIIGLLGITHNLLDDPRRAFERYEQARQANPSYPNVYNYWGYDLMRWQLDPEWAETARDKLDTALELNPSYVMPLANLSRLSLFEVEVEQRDNSTYQRAYDYSRRALEISPKNQRVAVGLGAILTEWGEWLARHDRPDEANRRYAEAQDILEQAWNVNPNNPWLLSTWGHLLDLLQRPDRAEEKYQLAIELEPRYASPRWRLAKLHDQQAQTREALISYRNWLRLAQRLARNYEIRLRYASEEVRTTIEQWQRQHREQMQGVREGIQELEQIAAAQE